MGKLQKQVRNHNNNMRNVRYMRAYDFNTILDRKTGNLLINGGEKDKRRACMLDYIVHARQNGGNGDSIVIFSGDRQLKKELICLATDGTIGQLYVCDSRYKNYNFFGGMKSNFVCDYFNCLAQENNVRDTSNLLQFMTVFFSLLLSGAPMCLDSICELASKSNSEISGMIGNKNGEEAVLGSSGGITFRSLLGNSCSAFSEIGHMKNLNGSICIKDQIQNDCVILIDAPSAFNSIFSVYFAMELKSLLDESFTCIFDDSMMLNHEQMRAVIKEMKQRPQLNVVVSSENIVSVGDAEEMLSNFNSSVVLLHGNTPSDDLQKVLSGYGQFTEMKIMDHEETPPHLLFTLIRGSGKTPVSITKDRVLLQEEMNNEAVLKSGSNSEIIITKKLYT